MAPVSAASGPLPFLLLTRMELRIGIRSTIFRLAALVALVLGWSQGATPGRGVALSAYTTGEAAWQYLGFVTIVWMSLAAVRETTLRTDILIFSKPQPGERLALIRFLGAFVQMLLILLAMFVGAAASRLFSGGLLGADVYVIQYLRVAGVLFFAAAASYTLALLFDSALAGALVGLFWILTLLGKPYLAKVYFPAYTQDLPAYLALGLGFLCLACWLYRRARRGTVPAAPWVRIGTPLALLLAAALFWLVLQQGHDPQSIQHPIMERMSEQDMVLGQRAPGFMLPDQYGRQIGLSDFPGRVLVIALLSPRDPEAVLALDRMNDLQARYGAQGVQMIALCLCEDNGAAYTFAQGERLQYPVVADWGTYNAPIRSEISPMASAYRAYLLPHVIVTDRRRRVRAILTGSDAFDGPSLEEIVRERLADEAKLQ